jgi:hypothetical protein
MADEKEIKTPKTEKVKAKAIQISTSTTLTGQVLLVALMDDGTMYQRIVNSDTAKWVEVPGI